MKHISIGLHISNIGYSTKVEFTALDNTKYNILVIFISMDINHLLNILREIDRR